jgi:microcystin-dependent protein
MSQPFVGEIRLVAFNFAPQGWSLCDGSLLAIAQNTVLFDLIGTTYGGNGQTTFAVPDLRGRVPVHMGTSFTIGQSAGEEQVTLTVNQIPVHQHPVSCDGSASNTSAPSGAVWGNWADAQYTDQSGTAQLNAGSVGSFGSNQPHDNMLPFVAINFVISLFGVFPSQN